MNLDGYCLINLFSSFQKDRKPLTDRLSSHQKYLIGSFCFIYFLFFTFFSALSFLLLLFLDSKDFEAQLGN